MLKIEVKELKVKLFFLFFAFLIIALDQYTKYLAEHYLQVAGTSIEFVPYFNFTLSYNKGAAMGLFSDASGWQRWFLAVVAIAVSVVLIIWILQLPLRKKLEITSLSLILGGAVGNLYDRIVLGKVVDFIDWFYVTGGSCLPFFGSNNGQCHWPTFNIADVAIMSGAFLLIIDVFFSREKTDETKDR